MTDYIVDNEEGNNMNKWIKTSHGNFVLTKTDKITNREFRISYRDFKEMHRKVVESLEGNPKLQKQFIKSSTYFSPPPETLFCIKGEEGGGILVGDHRKQYEAFDTIEECLKYYEENKRKEG